jgi:HEAT repeats
MTRTLIRLVLFATLLGAPAGAAEPTFLNADVRPLGAPAPDLEHAFASLLERDDGPAWVAYSVPGVGRSLCCHGPSVCSLERSGDCFVSDGDSNDGQELRVLLRFHQRRVTEIRGFSSGCRLDAGGLPVYVWDGVAPRRSLDFLIERARAGSEDVAEGALMVVAHHDDAEVDRVLERVARGELVPRRAEEAVFWLGEARGTAGFEALERLRHGVRDGEVLEQVAFALHLSEAPGALPALIDMARHDADGDVRGTALFWLSQQAGERAAAAIAEASEEDPDLEVKERAIFALSQLPPDRGVPLLIRYAQTHESPEIRKKAMFWLGQTEDPRALDFIEEVLTR